MKTLCHGLNTVPRRVFFSPSGNSTNSNYEFLTYTESIPYLSCCTWTYVHADIFIDIINYVLKYNEAGSNEYRKLATEHE